MAVVKNPVANAGDIRDTDLIPESGRSPGRGYSNPLQYACLENPMDREAWQATVRKVTQSRTQMKQLSAHTHTHTHTHTHGMFILEPTIKLRKCINPGKSSLTNK